MAIGIIVGVVVFAYGLMNVIKDSKKKKICTGSITAIVVDFDRVPSSNSWDMLYPIYDYTVNGQEYKMRSKIGKTKWNFKTGDTIEVRYNPENPKIMYVPSDKSKWAVRI